MEKNKLGNASLVLAILSFIGCFVPIICLSKGITFGGIWGTIVTVVLGYVLGYGLGVISFILGLVGVFKKNMKKISAIIGIVLSLVSICLPFICRAAA